MQIVKVATELLDTYREAIDGTIINEGGLRSTLLIWPEKASTYRGFGGYSDGACSDSRMAPRREPG